MNEEHFIAKVWAEPLRPWTLEEKKQLAAALDTAIMRKALREIYQMLDETDRMTGLNLTSADGVAQANLRQGKVLGINAVLSQLIELAIPEEDDGVAAAAE